MDSGVSNTFTLDLERETLAKNIFFLASPEIMEGVSRLRVSGMNQAFHLAVTGADASLSDCALTGIAHLEMPQAVLSLQELSETIKLFCGLTALTVSIVVMSVVEEGFAISRPLASLTLRETVEVKHLSQLDGQPIANVILSKGIANHRRATAVDCVKAAAVPISIADDAQTFVLDIREVSEEFRQNVLAALLDVRIEHLTVDERTFCRLAEALLPGSALRASLKTVKLLPKPHDDLFFDDKVFDAWTADFSLDLSAWAEPPILPDGLSEDQDRPRTYSRVR
jgi:hypothetical protein